MRYPTSTGRTAEILGVLEVRLNDLVRRGKIDPAPPVVSGRRLWEREHIAQAARLFGIADDEIERLVAEEEADRA